MRVGGGGGGEGGGTRLSDLCAFNDMLCGVCDLSVLRGFDRFRGELFGLGNNYTKFKSRSGPPPAQGTVVSEVKGLAHPCWTSCGPTE